MCHDVTAFIAKTLNIPPEHVTDDLTYQSISEWDSLNHVSLILALEEAFDIHIDSTLFVQLTSVAAIKTYLHSLDLGKDDKTAFSIPECHTHERQSVLQEDETSGEKVRALSGSIHRGLAGVKFDTTTITHIDGDQGTLSYRGYAIEDLVSHARFEEVAYLLVYKHLPTCEQLKDFAAQLKGTQELPGPVLDMIRSMVSARPVDVLRTAVSMLVAFDSAHQDMSCEGTRQRGLRLIAQIPLIITAHERLRHQQEPLAPREHLSFAANFLYMLTGREPSAHVAKIIDADLILHADHSSNASAFVARIVMSTQSELHAAISAAIAAFAGDLHGGAVEQVVAMLQEIGDPRRAADYVQRKRLQQAPIMGFGHRVYRTEDPRARQMRRMLQALSDELDERKWLEITDALIVAMQPYARHGVHINVDFYASVIYHLLAIPQDISVPLFILGRMAGWLAQILEQIENNILIRPLLHYVGEEQRLYLPLHQRGGAASFVSAVV